MGTYFALGGWLRFPDRAAKRRWLEQQVDSGAFTDGPGWLFGPAEVDEIDGASIGRLWKQVVRRQSIGRVLVVEDDTTLRFAASLDEGDGFAWGAGILAALRRADADGVTYGMFAEGGNVVAVERGALRDVDDDREAAHAAALPEFVAAFRRAGSLDDLPPLPEKRPEKAPTEAKRPPVVVPKKKPKFARPKLGTSADVHRLRRAPSGEVWAACAKGRIARLRESEWSLLQVGAEAVFDVAMTGKQAWAVGAGGTLVRLEGRRQLARSAPAKTLGSVFAEGDTVVVTSTDGGIFRSEDAGLTWRRVHDAGGAVGSLCRGSADRLIAVGPYGVVVVSDDLGRTFRETRRGNDAGFGCALVVDGVAWVCGMDRVMRSAETDTGALVYAGPKRDRSAMYTGVSSAGGAVWASLWGAVHRTIDGGETWELALERDENFSDVVALSAAEALVVGSGGFCARVTFS